MPNWFAIPMLIMMMLCLVGVVAVMLLMAIDEFKNRRNR